MTPAIFENALIEGKVKGLHQVTLMIFDECHHTHSDNIYNKIMENQQDRNRQENQTPERRSWYSSASPPSKKGSS